MNSHPIVLLDPIFKSLDWLIAEHGVYLYMAAVFLAPLAFAWILSGGFWRPRTIRHGHPNRVVKRRRPPCPPPLPAHRAIDGESQWFSA